MPGRVGRDREEQLLHCRRVLPSRYLHRLAGPVEGDRGGARHLAPNRTFYLATIPEVFAGVAEALGKVGLNQPEPGGSARLVIEKPFGRDLPDGARARRGPARASSTRTRSTASTTTSARRRSRTSSPCASPTPSSSRSGTAQLRRPRPDHGGRGPSASRSGAGSTRPPGALRDIVQNHVMQVLCSHPHGAADGHRRSSASATRR